MHSNDGISSEVKRKIIGLLELLFPKVKIYLYGSRARGKFRNTSDIDLAIDCGAVCDRLKLSEARSMFEASNIWLKIDLVDLHSISPDFKQIIMTEGKLWNQ